VLDGRPTGYNRIQCSAVGDGFLRRIITVTTAERSIGNQMQFRVSHLLLAMCLVSVTAIWAIDENRDSTLIFLFFVGSSGAAGLVWGWFVGFFAAENQVQKLTIPILSLSVANLGAWGLHRWAMVGIRENTLGLEFPRFLDAIVWLDGSFAFECVAVLVWICIAWAGYQRDKKMLSFFGACALLFWFLHFALAYLAVGLSLAQPLGLS